MTQTAFCILFDERQRPAVARLQNAQLEIVPVEAQPDHPPEQVVALVVAQLKQLGYQGQAVVLGLPSGDCLARALELGDGDSRDRAGLKFDLEEFLPFDAEQTVADFAWSDGCALGVAVENTKYARWVEALEAAGVWVQSISPVALLAIQFSRPPQDPGPRIVLWGHDGHLEMCEVVDGQPRQWQVLPADPPAALRRLRAALLHQPPDVTIEVHDAAPELVAALQAERIGGVIDTLDKMPLLEAAVRGSAHVLAGSHTPWIDLCREQLSYGDRHRALRPYYRLVTLAAVAFVITFLSAMWVRSLQYQAQVRQASNELEQLYRDLFPGRAAPVGVRSRLESELTNLLERRGTSIDVDATRSALPTVYDLLATVPADSRFQFTKIEFRPEDIIIDGEVLDIGQSQLIAAGLAERGFEVGVPYEERTEHGSVSFRLTARKTTTSPTPAPAAETTTPTPAIEITL